MLFEQPLRIISDVHFGHSACLLREAQQLTPLFRGAKTVIFNGDTVEMRFVKLRTDAQRNLEEIGRLCVQAGARPIFINGNHDPIASTANHLDLAGGEILVTHGDMLFHEIAPWSTEAGIVGAAHSQALARLQEEDALNDFERRLFAGKRASLALELHEPPAVHGVVARLATFARECWPPWRPLQIVKCWVETPGRAVALARTFRPEARFILIGHTHFSGVWERGGRTVINTGSFLPFSGRLAIDLHAGEMIVRKIVAASGGYALGEEARRWKLKEPGRGGDLIETGPQ